MPLINIQGKKFGRTTAVRRVGSDGRKEALWECLCECGVSHIALGSNLRVGNTNSCGCYKRQRAREANITHGFASRSSRLREYRIWESMRGRCNCITNVAFDSYGGRGIKVCKRWDNFAKFYADMGPCPIGRSLDRIDNNKGYSPKNCRWATKTEQNNNTRRNHRITYLGRTLTLAQWSRRKSLNVRTIMSRVKAGKTTEKILSRTTRDHKPYSKRNSTRDHEQTL